MIAEVISDDIVRVDVVGPHAARVYTGKCLMGTVAELNEGDLSHLTRLTKQELAHLLTAGPIRHLGLMDPVPAAADEEGYEVLSAERDFSISFRAVPDGMLGARLQAIRRKQGSEVGFEVVKKSAHCLSLSVGEVIIGISGISLLHMSPDNAMDLITKSSQRLLVIVQRDDFLQLDRAQLPQFPGTSAAPVFRDRQRQQEQEERYFEGFRLEPLRLGWGQARNTLLCHTLYRPVDSDRRSTIDFLTSATRHDGASLRQRLVQESVSKYAHPISQPQPQPQTAAGAVATDDPFR